MNKNIKRFLAIIAIILLLAMYGCAFVFAFIKSEQARILFRASIACTIMIPIFLYAFLLVGKVLKPGKSPLIDTVVFDVGNVLIGFDFLKYSREELGFSEETISNLVDTPRFKALWAELDHGVKSHEALYREYLEAFPNYHKEIKLYFDNIEKSLSTFSYSIPMLQELKRRGYRLYILSNFPEFAHDKLVAVGQMEIEAYMDGAIWSNRVKLVKPDPAIYEVLTKTYEITPERAVFIDDYKPNTEAAAACGYNVIHFKDFGDMKERLRSLGVKF